MRDCRRRLSCDKVFRLPARLPALMTATSFIGISRPQISSSLRTAWLKSSVLVWPNRWVAACSRAPPGSVTSIREASSVSGTLPYRAPKILRGDAADYRSDLWALWSCALRSGLWTPALRGTFGPRDQLGYHPRNPESAWSSRFPRPMGHHATLPYQGTDEAISIQAN